MTLVEGFTEVRPVNAVPVIAGLLFGPAGAWGCAAGNVIADLFGDFSIYSILGFFGNFAAAYVPYRLWHIVRGSEKPNVKTHGNLMLYVYLSAMGAMTTGIIIGCGLDVFFHYWSWQLFFIIICNDFLFPIFLGLPVLIVLTSDDHQFQTYAKASARRKNVALEINENEQLHHSSRYEKIICSILGITTIAVFTALNFGWVMSEQGWMLALGGIMCIGLMGLIMTD
jgi:energy-coupling factor transport system substrate-specific component